MLPSFSSVSSTVEIRPDQIISQDLAAQWSQVEQTTAKVRPLGPKWRRQVQMDHEDRRPDCALVVESRSAFPRGWAPELRKTFGNQAARSIILSSHGSGCARKARLIKCIELVPVPITMPKADSKLSPHLKELMRRFLVECPEHGQRYLQQLGHHVSTIPKPLQEDVSPLHLSNNFRCFSSNRKGGLLSLPVHRVICSLNCLAIRR